MLPRSRLLAALIPAALAVAALLPATAGAYTRGFQVYNLSSHPIKLDKLDLAGGATFDSAPPLGAVLLQGEAHDFEETYWFLTITNGTARYQILGDDGQSIGTFKASMAITAGGKVWSSCETTLGTCTPTPGTYDMHKLTLMDPESTVHEIPAGQGEAQARVLNKLCQENSSATCTFTPTDVISVNSPIHPVGNALINNTDEKQTTDVTISDTVGSTDSVELAAKAEAKLLKAVDAAIAAKYSHEWTTEHTFEQRVTVNCAAHTRCRILGTVPMLRYTGDLVVTMGNTTWTLRGVYFDSPSPDGAGAYEVNSRPLTAGKRASMPRAVIQTGTAGDDHLVGTDAKDLIFAGGGHDVVSGSDGHDRIYGGPGHDGILGGAGHDRIYGGAGRDRLRGGAGNDRLLGGLHRDRMVGGPGRDYGRDVGRG